VAEAGPFSYGAKKPRKGSIAANAEQKRKNGKQPIEPRDQMVGVAKVQQGVAEGSEKRCMQCGMKNCKCPGNSCKCKPIAGWIPGEGFKKVVGEAANPAQQAAIAIAKKKKKKSVAEGKEEAALADSNKVLRTYMDKGQKSYLVALCMTVLNPSLKIKARIGWYRDEDTDEGRVEYDHFFCVDRDGHAYDFRGKFKDTKALLDWTYESKDGNSAVINITVPEIHKLIQNKYLKGFDNTEYNSVKDYLTVNDVMNSQWTKGRIRPHELEPQLAESTFTSKQQVIDHFVSVARRRGENIDLAKNRGAAAWERGWRGSKPKEVKPFDPDEYKRHWTDD
jgi:hypothetical protein